MGGHEGHDHGSHGEGEMVCYNMRYTWSIKLTTEEDCEDAGLMWTENQQPDDRADDDMTTMATRKVTMTTVMKKHLHTIHTAGLTQLRTRHRLPLFLVR